MRGLAFVLIVACGNPAPPAPPPPVPTALRIDAFVPTERAREILDRTGTFEVRADTTALSEAERGVIDRLMRAGAIVQRLYERSRHPDAERVRAFLFEHARGDDARVSALRELYELFEGPIATDLETQRFAIGPVAPYGAWRNVYPPETEADALRAFADAHPQEHLLDERTLVRRRTEDALAADGKALADHPAIDVLHPGMHERLAAPADPAAFYAVPYSLGYADEVGDLFALLTEASTLAREDDADLADYLAERARDLLTDDYQGGDAAWVSGSYRHLNAQIGAYETYDDHLLGVKAFWSLSVLLRDAEASDEIAAQIARLSTYQDQLPGGPYPPVRAQIPIGVYDVIADFGQARGSNTASILPNEERNTRRFGRTILIRRNVLMNEVFVTAAQRRFRAAVAPEHAEDLGTSGNFDRTVWHEVGHYLGAHRTADDRDVTEALGPLHNTFEELKADLVSLFVLARMELAPERLRSAQAAGILRVLLASRPQRENAYGTMQLMQQRFFFDAGLLELDSQHKLRIHYDRYDAAIAAMLGQVLAIQRGGDQSAASAFVERWAQWEPNVQGALASAIEGPAPRFWLPHYAALEE